MAVLAGLAESGVAYAQRPQPTTPGAGVGLMMSKGPEGPLHAYLLEAMAKALGIPIADLQTRLANGNSFYQIALAQRFAVDEIATLIQAARSQAITAALAYGVITQAQAEWILVHAFGTGSHGQGIGSSRGSCDGMGVQLGTGMQRGRHWVQP